MHLLWEDKNTEEICTGRNKKIKNNNKKSQTEPRQKEVLNICSPRLHSSLKYDKAPGMESLLCR